MEADIPFIPAVPCDSLVPFMHGTRLQSHTRHGAVDTHTCVPLGSTCVFMGSLDADASFPTRSYLARVDFIDGSTLAPHLLLHTRRTMCASSQQRSHIPAKAAKRNAMAKVCFNDHVDVVWEDPERVEAAQQARIEGTEFLRRCTRWRMTLKDMDRVLGPSLKTKQDLGCLSSNEVCAILARSHAQQDQPIKDSDDSGAAEDDCWVNDDDDDDNVGIDETVDDGGERACSSDAKTLEIPTTSAMRVDDVIIFHDCACGLRCPVDQCAFDE